MTSDPTVQITVYDATRAVRGTSEGSLQLALPPGLFRVHFERSGLVHTQIIDHEAVTALHHAGPPLRSPVPLIGAATSHDYHIDPARWFSTVDTAPPLGAAPHPSRLFVFLRRAARDAEPRAVPSEPITIHDVDGRPLGELHGDTAMLDEDAGYAAFSCRVAPGTYRLRGVRSRRDIAITIPAGRAAHVFIADPGIARLDDLRVALVPVGSRFDPASPIALAMESLIAALRTSCRTFPAAARALLPAAAEADLCFGVAAAHLLWRCQDRAGFAAVVDRLAPFAELPDVAVLQRLARSRPGAPPQPLPLETPPLFRASLSMVMVRPELDSSEVPATSALAQAARTSLHDSVWCTWSARPWDERWIEPAVESLRRRDRSRPIHSIARGLALPVQTVEETLGRFDAMSSGRTRRRLGTGDAIAPGYIFESVLGRSVKTTVYSAVRLEDQRRVALKVVRLSGGPPDCARVLQRLERLERLADPVIVEPSAWGPLPDDAGVWLETELCQGSLLDRVSEADSPLALPDAYQVLLESAAALAQLHGYRRSHGDLKPGNLLVRADGRLAIGDLGLARCLADPDHPCTPRFAPPEVLAGAATLQPASDVWSLAAAFYFLLTFDLPRDEYAGQTPLVAARSNSIVPIAKRRPDLPPGLARCIDRALSPVIDRRPPTGEALCEELLKVKLRPEPGRATASDAASAAHGRFALGSELALEPLLEQELTRLATDTGAATACLELHDGDPRAPRYRKEISVEAAQPRARAREISPARREARAANLGEVISRALTERRAVDSRIRPERFADLGSSREPLSAPVVCAPIFALPRAQAPAEPPAGVLYLVGRTSPGGFTAADRERVERLARLLSPIVARLRRIGASEARRLAIPAPAPPPAPEVAPRLAEGTQPRPAMEPAPSGSRVDIPTPPIDASAPEPPPRGALVLDDGGEPPLDETPPLERIEWDQSARRRRPGKLVDG